MQDGSDSRSGAGVLGTVVAVVTAAYAVALFLLLCAESAGPAPSTAALVTGIAVLVLALRPLAVRTTKVLPLVGLLALGQLGAQGLLLMASGALGEAGARALVCCPPAPATGSDPLAALTSAGGWWLTAAQLVVCLLLAVAVRSARLLLDLSLAAIGVVATAAGTLLRLPVALLQALRLPVPVLVPAGGERWDARGMEPLVGLLLAREVGRRGPPTGPARLRALPVHPTLA